MEIEECLDVTGVFTIGLAVVPPFFQFAPGGDADYRIPAAVDVDQFSPLGANNRDPVVPAVDAEQTRISFLQGEQQLTTGAERILAPDQLQLAIIGFCRAGKLDFIGSGPPVRACDSRNSL